MHHAGGRSSTGIVAIHAVRVAHVTGRGVGSPPIYPTAFWTALYLLLLHSLGHHDWRVWGYVHLFGPEN